MIIEKKELVLITGGGFTATLLNSISRATTTVFNLGRAVGSSIRRIKTGRLCPL